MQITQDGILRYLILNLSIVRVEVDMVGLLPRSKPLVEMKLNSWQDKDRTHLRDMIEIGLIDESWPQRFNDALAARLQELLDNPEG